MNRGDGVFHLLAYTFFELASKEVGEDLQSQDNILGVMRHRFSFLLIVSLLTIIMEKILFG